MHKAAWMAMVGLLLAVPATAQVDGDVIYGNDDRLDIYQVNNSIVLKLADSTVGLFKASRVHVGDPSGEAHLVTDSYSEKYNLCPDERFFNQRTGAFCSGSLVGPDLLMTAGHCVKSEVDCKDTKFVFGFAITKEGELPHMIPAREVYGCRQLLGRHQDDVGADWALIRLDRLVTNHKPLAMNRSGTIRKNTPLFVIGHPAGLPTKVAGGASVRDPYPQGFFVANLDTYGGNSGSAVFNASNGQVEGILVRGEVDYVWRGNCRVSKVCTNDGCSGEQVTKASAVRMPRDVAIFSQAPVLRSVKPSPTLARLLELYGAGKDNPIPEVTQVP